MSGFYTRLKEEKAAARAMAAQGVQPKYKVLQADMLKQVDREKASAVSSFIRSKDEAFKLESHEGFSYADLDLRGRVGVVRYRGVEVALLFHRLVTERELGPGEPVPTRTLKEPHDAWIQVDLINMQTSEAVKGSNDITRRLQSQVERLKMMFSSEENLRAKLEEKVNATEAERAQLAVLKEKVGLLETSLKTAEKETENWKREALTQKEARRADKVNTVRELVPMFNTAWLAGIHRVEDKLYGMLKKQMVEVLGRIGVTLIEPTVGTKFDPERHHAIHSYSFAAGAPEVGTVVQVSKLGWAMGSMVIEAAEVAVGVEQEELLQTPTTTEPSATTQV